MESKVTRVVLCGSTRFEADFVTAMRELSLRGIVTIGLSVLPRDNDGKQVDGADKEMLDLVHFAKISMADAIFVVGDGYIGYSTAREILWAHINNKTVVLQDECCRQEPGPDWNEVARRVRLDHGPSAVGRARARSVLRKHYEDQALAQIQPQTVTDAFGPFLKPEVRAAFMPAHLQEQQSIDEVDVRAGYVS